MKFKIKNNCLKYYNIKVGDKIFDNKYLIQSNDQESIIKILN